MACDLVLNERSFAPSSPVPLAHRDLRPTVHAPAEARDFAVDTLTMLGRIPPDIIYTAQLLTSELVTNAVLHARTEIHVGIAYDDRTLLITVADGHAHTAPAQPSREVDYEESGRGMTIVAGLADDFGWQPRPGLVGKVMWALVAIDRRQPLASVL